MGNSTSVLDDRFATNSNRLAIDASLLPALPPGPSRNENRLRRVKKMISQPSLRPRPVPVLTSEPPWPKVSKSKSWPSRTISCPAEPPILQPSTSDSEPDLSPELVGSFGKFESGPHQVEILESSPLSSYRAFVANDEFDFLPANDALSRTASTALSRRSLSVRSMRSMRSNFSQLSAKSDPLGHRRYDSVDAGIPPRVPPHRVLHGHPTPSLPPPGLVRSRTVSDPKPMPVEIYTRRCAADMRPELASENTTLTGSPADKLEPRFLLDGYHENLPLKVVNTDPNEPTKYFRKSKAQLAKEQEYASV